MPLWDPPEKGPSARATRVTQHPNPADIVRCTDCHNKHHRSERCWHCAWLPEQTDTTRPEPLPSQMTWEQLVAERKRYG